MKKVLLFALAAFFTLSLVLPAFAADVDPALAKKLDAKFKEISTWAADKTIVSAVTAAPPADAKAMTQEKWKSLSVLDTFVRSLSKNAAADFLKSKQSADPAVSEAFLSFADGSKAAFLSKPSNWSHKGKPKHDDPMAGKKWTGPVEKDVSTGMEQVQIAVPVLSGGKPAGSLVVGFAISKLK